MPKYLKQLLEVVWHDAETTYGWENDDEVDAANVPIITIGFLVRRTEDVVILASSIDATTGTQSNSRIKIPVAMIQSVKELGIPTPRKKKEVVV